MMYSIRASVFISVILVFFSCVSNGLSPEEYDDLCPYERQHSGWPFYLEAPIIVSPHQQTYRVGDTITFTIDLTDSIKDLSREMMFEIKNYPFQPFFHLYRIDEKVWTSGFESNTILIDSIYRPRIVGGSSFATSLRGFSTYINNEYKFEFKYIPTKPGIYINYVIDNVEAIDKWDIEDGDYPEYLTVENSSGCPDPEYTICYTLQGNPHYSEFEAEMRYLDEEVYFDRMCNLEGLNEEIWGGGTCRHIVDWRGVFGFEVVE